MTVDTSVCLAGLKLKTPLILAAGPLSRDAQSIRRLAEAGCVGAVVLKTIYSTDADTPRPYLAKVKGGLLNFDWSATGVGFWTDNRFGQLLDLGLPMIASIYDGDDGTLVRIAQTLERLGAAMIELPAAGTPPARLQQLVSRVRAGLHIPIAVKIGWNEPDLRSSVKAVEDGGADVIVATNTVGPCLAIDTETGRPLMGNCRGYGYLSGAAIHPISLRVVADAVSMTELPVVGVGGVEDAHSAVAMFMAGAQAVQLHTAAILRGVGVFGKIAEGIESYLEMHGHASLDALVGMSQQYLVDEPAFDRFLPVVNRRRCNHCSLCERMCVYGAVTMVGELPQFNLHKCRGCGLCITACTPGALATEKV